MLTAKLIPNPFIKKTLGQMTIYHFVPAHHGLDNIKRRRLKIATIPDLNDPFELLCVDLSDREIRDRMRKWKLEMGMKYGLLCFSKSWRNPVQWSHYADKHRGIALGFEVPPGVAMDVNYKEQRSKEEAQTLLSKKGNALGMMRQFLSTKYAHWSYEQECRIYTELKGKDEQTSLYFSEFSDSMKLTEVIIGAESNVTRNELNKALGDLASSVSIRNVRLAFTSYRVAIQNNPNFST